MTDKPRLTIDDFIRSLGGKRPLPEPGGDPAGQGEPEDVQQPPRQPECSVDALIRATAAGKRRRLR